MEDKDHLEHLKMAGSSDALGIRSVTSRKKKMCLVLNASLFMLCFAGFCYQATEFLTHLFEYPTVISINVERPGNFVLPAYTMCNTYPLQREKYCLMYPNRCTTRGRSKLLCERFPEHCTWNESEIDSVFPKSMPRIHDLQSRNEFKFLAESKRGFFFNQIEGIKGPFPLNDTDGRFVSCFTKHARFDSVLEKEFKAFEKSSSTEIGGYYLHMYKNDFLDPDTKVSALLYIHSPFVGTKFSFNSILLKRKVNYKIHIRLEEERLLPHPYKTDCIDYEKLWRGNYRTGPRSREMCESLCDVDYDRKCYGCVRTILPLGIPGHRMPVEPCVWSSNGCEDNSTEYEKLWSMRNSCRSHCKRDCLSRKYLYSVEERFEDHFTGPVAHDYTYVQLVVDDPEILVISHEPKYLDVELFSYIGGFMGCWLGISIWKSTGMIKSMVLATRACLKRRKPSTKHTETYLVKEMDP